MNILFISYWGIDDGLSKATVLPHVETLREMNPKGRVFLLSIERGTQQNRDYPDHIPYPSGNSSLDKLKDLIFLPKFIKKVLKTEEIDLVICRSSMAGSFGYLAVKSLDIPFIVESFEPHADYMLNSDVWSRFGLRYTLQSYLERKQVECAQKILPLTQAYSSELISKGFPKDKFMIFPCTVDTSKYQFNPEYSKQKKAELGVDPSLKVGIYVGKKSGIYYDREIFQLFSSISENNPNIFFLVLTPDHVEDWNYQMQQVNIKESRYRVLNASFEEVPMYLSAADFAFNFHRSSAVSHAFSPIKNREYWANGLPILIPNNIGDDTRDVEKYRVGNIIDMQSSQEYHMLEKSLNNICRFPISDKSELLSRIDNSYIRKMYSEVLGIKLSNE